MGDYNDPIIYSTQKQLAWDAWTKACGLGDGWLSEERTKAQQKAFESWWTDVAEVRKWSCLRELIQAAWDVGPFLSYWQRIVDSQPQVTP